MHPANLPRSRPITQLQVRENQHLKGRWSPSNVTWAKVGSREVFLRISQNIPRHLKIYRDSEFLHSSTCFYCCWRYFRTESHRCAVDRGFVQHRHLKYPGLKFSTNRYWGINEASTTSWKPWSHMADMWFSQERNGTQKPLLQTKLRLHDIYQRLEALAKESYLDLGLRNGIFPQTQQVTDISVCITWQVLIHPILHQRFWDILTSAMFRLQSRLLTIPIAAVDDFNPRTSSPYPLRRVSRCPGAPDLRHRPASENCEIQLSNDQHPGWLAS